MKKIAVIPARYASTRFPYKLMQFLGDKPVIRHTYDNTVATGLFEDVIVATDHISIYNEIIHNGGNAVMSKNQHESGSDRIAEAVEDLDAEIILNVQGDEPFISRTALFELLQAFEGEDGKNVQVASLMKPFSDMEIALNPNIVKVVVDKRMNSLLFSRSVVPYYRDEQFIKTFFEHIGVYAFRKNALMQFTKWAITPLEAAEKIECLRYLENGIQLKMVITNESSVKIDVPEDLDAAIRYLNDQQ
jgi:3-deoxy-D-manno-octulosonate cytidylyltransferase